MSPAKRNRTSFEFALIELYPALRSVVFFFFFVLYLALTTELALKYCNVADMSETRRDYKMKEAVIKTRSGYKMKEDDVREEKLL